MSKYVFDLVDGENYWLVGPQGALLFNTKDDEGINIGAICKLEKYEEDSKMSKKCEDCKHYSTMIIDEPCNDCYLHYGKHPKFEPAVPESAEAKSDAGKPKLTLVPQQIIWDIAEVREYGNKKYGDPDNWKTVEKERYRDAAFRHMLQYLADPDGVDEESKLPHLWHLATNCAFLCELEKNEYDIQRNKKTIKKE